jgi:hypothetical protein
LITLKRHGGASNHEGCRGAVSRYARDLSNRLSAFGKQIEPRDVDERLAAQDLGRPASRLFGHGGARRVCGRSLCASVKSPTQPPGRPSGSQQPDTQTDTYGTARRHQRPI